jgi:hypothetical protein
MSLLDRLLQDEDPEVREAARSATFNLNGRAIHLNARIEATMAKEKGEAAGESEKDPDAMDLEGAEEDEEVSPLPSPH